MPRERERRQAIDRANEALTPFCHALLAVSRGLELVSYDVVRRRAQHRHHPLREQQGSRLRRWRARRRDNVFRRIKTDVAAPPGAHPGSNQTKQGNDE